MHEEEDWHADAVKHKDSLSPSLDISVCVIRQKTKVLEATLPAASDSEVPGALLFQGFF